MDVPPSAFRIEPCLAIGWLAVFPNGTEIENGLGMWLNQSYPPINSDVTDSIGRQAARPNGVSCELDFPRPNSFWYQDLRINTNWTAVRCP